MLESLSVDIHRVTCPDCLRDFFEFDGKEIFQCPHCGANCRHLDDGQCEYKEVVVYLDPLSGRVSTEVA